MGKTAMLGLIDSLSRTVRSLSWNPPASTWSNYTDESNYTSVAHRHKQQLIAEWCELVRASDRVSLIWDLGANTGVYSRIAADDESTVVSFDFDHSAVEQHFRKCRDDRTRRILPLLQDLTNPTAGAGWRNAERRSLEERGPADLVLALALIHHLVISGNLPLPEIANFLHAVCRHLVIEFVPREDSQIQRMLTFREDTFADYSQAQFENAFRDRFELVRSVPVEQTERTLYLMSRR
jgi:ribosomal protein L11 methylase PrmA